jgi:outer membrane beta-barrel protein
MRPTVSRFLSPAPAAALRPGIRPLALAVLLAASLAQARAQEQGSPPAPAVDAPAAPVVDAPAAPAGDTTTPSTATPQTAAPALPAAEAQPTAPRGGTPMNEKPADQQVIEPQIDRRDVRVPHIPSNDFEVGVFTGTYDTQNFGASLVGGVRGGYHITEDVFVEAVYGRTKVSDKDFRQILPGGIFPTPTQTLSYYDLSVGYNLFPGEIFLARNHAKVSTIYLIAGVGSTKFDAQSHETVNVGAGSRVFLADWVAIELDVRDHVYSVNLLGLPQTTQNLELTAGVTFFF